MSDIFISYASEDRPSAERIARALQAQGWSVWWDRAIPAGRRFPEVIQEEIEKARCMVVLWSGTSIKKDWVIEEASEGRDRRILVPVLVEPVQPPRGFRLVQAADLAGWTGDVSPSSFQGLCRDISALIGPGSKPALGDERPVRPAEMPVRPPQFRAGQWRWLVGGALLAVIVCVGVVVYKVATGRGAAVIQKGNQTPEQSGARTNPKDGLSYVWIAPGEFWMGATPGDSAADTDEKPRHQVRITKGFWMGETLVTVGAYKRFVKEWPRLDMPPAPSYDPDWSKEDHPVVSVTWNEAQAYCAWAGGTSGRLPTEAQWEYAARGGWDGLKYPWGNEITPANANYRGSKWKGTSPVRSYPPNAWGLYDMAGNVWEWMADWYDKDYYSTLPADKPTDDPRGTQSETMRALRGGSSDDVLRDLRASGRNWDGPGDRNYGIGFRCVRAMVP